MLPKGPRKEALAANKEFFKQVIQVLVIAGMRHLLQYCSCIVHVGVEPQVLSPDLKILNHGMQVEALDLALLKKDEAKAMKALQGAKESLESTIAKLG